MRTALSRKRTKPGSPLADINTSTNILSSDDEESLLRQRSDAVPRNNPFALVSRAKVLLHKICRISAGANSREGREGVIGLLQDLVGGIALGTLGMSILLLSDYYNIINLETARVFRKTAANVFNTPGILESLEEELERKFISMDVYKSIKEELSDSQAVIKNEMKVVGARSIKETSLKAELSLLREEYDGLIKDTGLDAFCPDCKWGMGMNCQQRVNYMLENYSDTATTIECISKLVIEGKTKNDKCLKT
mmetsp:Transcript_33000/g.69458  ORF Transcript_33000/g.69458 Transcript_33000/m.69458 type:complete len:251 (-) Transcript_33000:18-770(-)